MKTTETDKDSRRKLLENPEVQDIMVGLLKYRRPMLLLKKSFVKDFVADELSKLNEPDPIITTHDGVNVMDANQKVWTINWISSQIFWAQGFHHSEDRIWFSTRAAAEAHLETFFEGYAAPFDMWEGLIKKGDVFNRVGIFSYECNEARLPAEIVTTWEKRYRKP